MTADTFYFWCLEFEMNTAKLIKKRYVIIHISRSAEVLIQND